METGDATMDGQNRASVLRYLRVVGAVNAWFLLVFLAFAAWVLYIRILGKPSYAGYFFLYLLPFASGTGLLTAGRRGYLDLILGTDITRSRIWWIGFGYAWGLPLVLGLFVIWLSAVPPVVSTLMRVPCVLLLTCGVSFAVGLVETRYAVAVLWLIARIAFFLTPASMDILRRLDTANALPHPALLALATILTPESALSSRMPLAFLLAGGLIGALALIVSWRRFHAAEFAGKRA